MINEDIQYEVQVTNAYKNYGANNVFNGLNMNVTSGSIYGLLGPSGCGKSTLLHCILGTMTLDSGTIDLKVESLKDVGYMPQDLCLETELTINETFEYYGTLYKMNEKSIKTKKVELTTFLQLSNTDSYIKDLSGGQSRRVSLAISLLHDPKLIILDEPTVGIDPILRNDIWTEFTKMVVQHKKTIIITTHYIEEANQANCIGLMRNGVIIEEKSPQDILTKCNTDSLESAFLELCCNQDKNENHMAKNVPAKEVPRKNKLKKIENNIDFHRIKALFKKNWQVFSRDYMLLFSVIFLPLLQMFNFCNAIGNDFKNMPITFKNDEVNYESCKNFSTQRCIFDESFNEAMSCVVLDYFASQNYKLIEVKDQEAGEMSMNNAGNMAFIYFQRNYTKDLIKYINRDDNITEYSIFMHITNENFLFKNQIRMDVYKSYNHLMKTVLNNCNINPRTINLPVDVHTIVGNDVKIYTNGIIALFIEMTIFFLLSSFGASIVLTEKISGILNRSMFAGVNLMEFSTALFCLCTLILSVQSVLFCLISYVLFFNPIITSGLFLYSFGLLLSGWIGFLFVSYIILFVIIHIDSLTHVAPPSVQIISMATAFRGPLGFVKGVLTAVLSTTILGGVYVITGLALSQFLLSGGIWPVEGQPEFLRIFTRLMPMRIIGNMINNIALKGWSLSHLSIIMDISMSLLYIVILVLLLIVLGKFKKHWWIKQK